MDEATSGNNSAQPSAVMQALQSFQAAAEASCGTSTGGSSSINSGGGSTTVAQQQNIPAASLPIPTPQPQTQQSVGSLAEAATTTAGMPLMMPAATNDMQQLFWQQALQTLATVQLQQQQQPQSGAAFTPSSLQPIAPATAAQQQQQQLFQLQNLLTFPVQAVQQQQTTQPPQPMQPVAAAAATSPLVPSVASPAQKKRRKDPPVGNTSHGGGPSVISLSSRSRANAKNNHHHHHHHTSNNNNNNMDFNKPPQEKTAAELSKMTQSERRRYERNLREQQRSYKISQQIKELRDVLQESNIPFRPNKYSILVSVAEYIRQLQGRAVMLDSEHQRLIDTIRQTNDFVTSAVTSASGGGGGTHSLSAYSVGEEPVYSSSSVDGGGGAGGFCNSSSGSSADGLTPHNLLLVQGIDYLSVFRHCPYPIGVATLDGRMLDCNGAFEELLQVAEPGSLKDQSFFSFIRNHQEIFQAMAGLLKQSSMQSEAGLDPPKAGDLFWNGELVSQRNERVRLCGVNRLLCISLFYLHTLLPFSFCSFLLPSRSPMDRMTIRSSSVCRRLCRLHRSVC